MVGSPVHAACKNVIQDHSKKRENKNNYRVGQGQQGVISNVIICIRFLHFVNEGPEGE